MNELTFQFATKDQALAFATWLCEIAEQDYWNFAELRVKHHKKDRRHYVGSFEYHGPDGLGDFCADMTIRTRGVPTNEDAKEVDATLCQQCKGTGIADFSNYPHPSCDSCKGTGIGNFKE